MCLYPRFTMNPRYKKNKKNGGVIPPCSDNRILYIPIGCGNCVECRKKKANDWMIRLHEEFRTNSKNCKFVTLTFDNNNLKKHQQKAIETIGLEIFKNKRKDIRNEGCKIAVREFLERIRAKTGKSVRHWLITELGGGHNKRIHMHGFIWADADLIKEKWQNGYVYIGDYMSPQAITYTTKYVQKINKREPMYMPKIMTSSGIGNGWLKRSDAKRARFNGRDTIEEYVRENGRSSSLPIYYRNKLYSENQREELWINKLDKNERWIAGERVRLRDFDNIEDYKQEILRLLRHNQRLIGNGTKYDMNKYDGMMTQLYAREYYQEYETTRQNNDTNNDTNNGMNDLNQDELELIAKMSPINKIRWEDKEEQWMRDKNSPIGECFMGG